MLLLSARSPLVDSLLMAIFRFRNCRTAGGTQQIPKELVNGVGLEEYLA